MLRTFFLKCTCLLLTSCSSIPVDKALQHVQPGMSKTEVLEAAGNPKRTYREHGQDHWIYVYFAGNRELSREVVFEAGKVEKVSRPRTKTNWAKELEDIPASSADAGFNPIDDTAD